MESKRPGIAGVLLALVLLLAGCGNETECGEFPLDEDDRICVVETIDEMVDEHYPFAEDKGVDLDAFSAALWSAVDDAEDGGDADFLADVNRALTILEDGHTRIEQQRLEEVGMAPAGVRRVDGEIVVDRVDDPDRAELIGASVAKIDGVDADRALADAKGRTETSVDGEVSLSGNRLALGGEAGSELRMTMDDGTTVTMTRVSPHDKPEVRRYGDDIGYLRIDTFAYIDDLERIDAALAEVEDTSGLMIDLRGNGGGYPSVTEGLFARLIAEERSSFEMVDVDGEHHRTLEMEPRGETYEGEVVLLVDRGSYSASNFFSHRVKYHRRGVLVGEQTGGGAASPQQGVMLLPGVWFQVSTHVVRDPDGEHAESGLTPEIPVDIEEESGDEGEIVHPLGATGDPVKDRAIRYLEGLP